MHILKKFAPRLWRKKGEPPGRLPNSQRTMNILQKHSKHSISFDFMFFSISFSFLFRFIFVLLFRFVVSFCCFVFGSLYFWVLINFSGSLQFFGPLHFFLVSSIFSWFSSIFSWFSSIFSWFSSIFSWFSSIFSWFSSIFFGVLFNFFGVLFNFFGGSLQFFWGGSLWRHFEFVTGLVSSTT